MKGCRRFVATAAAAMSCFAAGRSWGQTVPNCSDTTMFPNPIYLAGSTAYQPTAALFAAQLANLSGTDKVTLIYQNGLGSCDGPAAILNGNMLTGTATVWAPGPNFANDITSVTKSSCTLDGTHAADVGPSDVFWKNCPNLAGMAQPATIKDFQGPVQAMIFVVAAPQNTSFTAMSAQEAQLIWGCGTSGMVSPFDDIMGIQQRNSNSGSQGLVAKTINVPPTGFFGKTNSGGGDVVTSMMSYVTSHNPNKAIGFIAGDLFDTNRTNFYPVAFQQFNQTKAFYADSSRDAKDRKNVRDGHYGVWGPEHFYAAVDTSGTPTNAAAAKFLGATFGTMYSSNFNYIQLQSIAGVIPQCAMKVTRDDDGILGPVKPKTDVTNPCGCAFEKYRTGLTSCTACPNGNSDCSGGKTCHYGYCE
jgi:hypothetical protein